MSDTMKTAVETFIYVTIPLILQTATPILSSITAILGFTIMCHKFIKTFRKEGNEKD